VELNPERYADETAVRFPAEGAYAQVLPGLHTWMLDWAFDPGHDDAGRSVLAAALDEVARRGGGDVQVWLREPTDATDAVATALGLRTGRDLYEMRVPLPLAEPVPELDWRPFVVGEDEAAWLEVNNAAFGSHAEQGGWTMAQIAEGEAEPWFDPAGFVMVELDGRLAGFCWTKVHADHDPVLGEIYVIASHPDFGGRGLGKRICVTALDWMHRERGAPVGMLYVDSDNEPAVRLYRGLGFTPHHTDRAYAGSLPATS
jgi:mycothiol synthase